MRSSGLLLHVTSLPTRFGIGDLGPGAWRFVDTLVETGQTWWQILPVCPVGLGDSPYASPASFAGNPILISPELMVQDGWATEAEINAYYPHSEGHVDFPSVSNYKSSLLRQAYSRFVKQPRSDEFRAFLNKEQEWLLPYAAFQSRKVKNRNRIWTSWALDDLNPPEHFANPDLLDLQFYLFEQFIFDSQWRRLHDYCHRRGVKIMGDLPIYVAHDSVDVWAHPELFQLDDAGEPLVVAGVPPDFFSQTGQRWGNPIYRWDRMEAQGFDWWIRRMKRAFSLYDSLRLDHFRGFAGYWEIPASEKTAIHGRWATGPGQPLFERLTEALGPLSLVAEDLGVITPDVIELMDINAFPGMAVIQFGFDAGMDNLHLPHNYKLNQCVYTGTHDNNTLLGWWNALSEYEHGFAKDYLNIDSDKDVCQKTIERCLSSDAGMVILPVQDVLQLGSEARMNFPGTPMGNWRWSLLPEQHSDLREIYGQWLYNLTRRSGRLSTQD
ncbi:MAG: 4-alpha-glucanotransferase [Bacteroidetes bacterium]|nr:4-alpha-glucanotransferase [Bacteroidota bacterium]MCY4204417.1 4-alpha-glucanotransferase [Bacteroidota bacterium]